MYLEIVRVTACDVGGVIMIGFLVTERVFDPLDFATEGSTGKGVKV